MSMEGTSSKETHNFRASWLGYGAQILTLFFALAILTGRVYAQSYWNVFGLSPELINTTFIDYAVMSPNAALASILIAIGTIVVVAFMRQRTPDIIGSHSPKDISIIGTVAILIGVSAFLVLKLDSSTWPSGAAGLLLGLGFLLYIGGLITFMQALGVSIKKERKEPSKLVKFLFGWTKKLPFIIIHILFIALILSTGLWGILDTAQRFGANEAKFMYLNRPTTTIELDSSKGFEDIVLVADPGSAVISNFTIIAETNGFLYITRLTVKPLQFNVRAVPVSRVQAIQYNVATTPIGE